MNATLSDLVPGYDAAAMLDAYIGAALFTCTDNTDDSGGRPLDAKYSADDLAADAHVACAEDCERFVEANVLTFAKLAADGGVDWGQAGHDLWLTRNRHGAGFWDGEWPAAEGNALTVSSHTFGEVSLYVGDVEDGEEWIYAA